MIRTDASAQIGSGHVMRCLALAQAWRRRGGHVTMLSVQCVAALRKRFAVDRMQFVRLAVSPGSARDAKTTVKLMKDSKANWVVVDGYQFDCHYQQEIKSAGVRLLCVDDYGQTDSYVSDLILNQNISADVSLYKRRAPYTRLLLGTRYALLRQEFGPFRRWKRTIASMAGKVLITMGGSDPLNASGMILRMLQRACLSQIEVRLVVGGANQHGEELKKVARGLPFPVRLVRNTRKMPELMAWADIAISAAGSTCWELAFMGLPSLLVILSSDQERIAEVLDERGVAMNLGKVASVRMTRLKNALVLLMNDKKRRGAMSAKGRELVDGKGAERVVQELLAST